MATTVTKTVKPSGGDYTSLANWEAGEQGDLTGVRDEISVAECYSMSDTTIVSIDGWTTSATQYIRVYTPTAERHTGVWNTGKYRLECSSASNVRALSTTEAYIRIDGLQIFADATSTNWMDVLGFVTAYPGATSYIEATNNIIKGINDNYGSGIYVNNSIGYIYNNIIYDLTGSTSYGIYTNATIASLYIYNNTITDCDYGVRGASGAILKNNLLYNHSLGATTAMTTGNCGYNSTDAASLGYTAQTGDRVSQTFTFVDSVNDDFHLASGDGGAKDFGTDLSGSFTTDIDGVARTGTWDIGADEYVVTGGLSMAGPNLNPRNTSIFANICKGVM